MRRADRLIKLTHFLRRRRRAVTARQIAEAFDICKRTVYRDIRDLMDAGVPIRGEAGVGYLIDKQYYLPPITFDADELEAVGLGISMVRQWTDDGFATRADSAFEKILAALPAARQDELRQITTWSVSTPRELPWTTSFSTLRECIRARHRLRIRYHDLAGKTSARTLQPLALIFASPVWMLAAWCEIREDFRHFRLDRILSLDETGETFDDTPERNLGAYLAHESACQSDIVMAQNSEADRGQVAGGT